MMMLRMCGRYLDLSMLGHNKSSDPCELSEVCAPKHNRPGRYDESLTTSELLENHIDEVVTTTKTLGILLIDWCGQSKGDADVKNHSGMKHGVHESC